MFYRLLLFPILLTCICGCSTEDTNTLNTVSAVVLSIPVIPFVEAYHFVSGDIEKEQERGIELANQFRVVYEKRTQMLLDRDPESDAKQLISRGIVFIMPMDFPRKYDFNMYPGMPAEWIRNIPKDFIEETINEITKDEVALYLMTLTSNDPRQNNSVSSAFRDDPIYKNFWQSRHSYKEKFNTVMANALNIANKT